MSEEERFNEFCVRCRNKYLPDDIMKPVDVERLMRFTIPSDIRPDEKVIKGITKNWSTKKPDNIMYHLLRTVPKLFIAGLHCETPTDEYGCPTSGHKFHTKFLSKRLEEPFEEIKLLEKELLKTQEDNHYDEMMELKNTVKDLREQIKELKETNNRLEDKIKFKDEMLDCRPSIASYETLKMELEFANKQLAQINS